MPFWKRSSGSTSPPGDDHQLQSPHRASVVDGRLSATILLHAAPSAAGPVPCWSFTTDGFAALGQNELVVSVRARNAKERDGVVRDIRGMLSSLFALVDSGETLGEGGFSIFRGVCPTGFAAVGYVRPLPLGELAVPSTGWLSAIPLHTEEAQLAATQGLTRVLSRIGKVTSHYPCPPWWDPMRASVANPAQDGRTLITRVARCGSVATAVLEDDRISLRMPSDGSAQPVLNRVFGHVSARDAWVMTTTVPIDADALLTWRPGQTEPTAITPPGSAAKRTGGCFVLFLPAQSADDCEILEDGFLVNLTNASAERLRSAFEVGAAFDTDGAAGRKRFSLVWPQALERRAPG